VVDHGVDGLDRLKRATVTGMAGLGSLAAPREGRSLTLRRARRVLAGRQRGVARVAAQAPLEILDPGGQLDDPNVLSRYPLREGDKNSNDDLAPLLVDRLGLGPLHTQTFDAAGEDPSPQHTGAPINRTD